MKPICDVIVLTWNQLNTIREFVDSFLEKTETPSRLIIVDNGSKDKTSEYLKSLKGSDIVKIDIVLNENNKGFVGGMNQGIELSDTPYICLANNDLTFTKGWLREVISVFENNKKIGVLNPNSNSLGLNPDKNINLDKFAENLRNKYGETFVEMPFCIGYCMFIRKEVIDRVGGLSEEFMPIFFEDSDYSMKAQKAGFLIGIAKGSYVWHEEHGSFGHMGKRQGKIFRKSKVAFVEKWGRILRIAWIVDNHKELLDNLEEGINLSRQGNYVWFFVKDLDKTKAEIFKENNLIEHSGVNFIKYNNLFDLTFKILKKKKKYNPLISDNRMVKYLFPKLGYNVLNELAKGKIEKIKRL